MSLPSEGIKDLLVAASVGTFAATSGWGIFINKEPAAPNTTITIFDTGGFTPNPKWLLDYPSVQVRVRGDKSGYVDAQTKIIQVKDVLLGLDSQDLNGDRWVAVNMQGDILSLSNDQNERPLFVVNFRLIIQPAASAETNRTAL